MSSRSRESKDKPLPLSDEFQKAIDTAEALIKKMDKDLEEMKRRFNELLSQMGQRGG